MEFTLNRNFTLVTTKGHSVAFVKDEPTHVPKEIWPEAQAIGAVPVEEIVEAEITGGDNAPTDPAERKERIFEAFEMMVLANVRDEFMGTGMPNIKALIERVGFKVDSKERDALWIEFQQKGE